MIMITSGEPVPAGQSPIPVIIIQSPEGMSTGEVWLTGSTIALTVVTLLTLAAMVHQDHELVKAVIAALKALTPPYRRPDTLRGEPGSRETSNGPTVPVNKIMSDRSA